LGGASARRKAATYTGQHKQNKRRQTSMPRVGFELMIPLFERAKTVHTLDRAATVIGEMLTQSHSNEASNVMIAILRYIFPEQLQILQS
jgi:hypothetical protein